MFFASCQGCGIDAALKHLVSHEVSKSARGVHIKTCLLSHVNIGT